MKEPVLNRDGRTANSRWQHWEQTVSVKRKAFQKIKLKKRKFPKGTSHNSQTVAAQRSRDLGATGPKRHETHSDSETPVGINS